MKVLTALPRNLRSRFIGRFLNALMLPGSYLHQSPPLRLHRVHVTLCPSVCVESHCGVTEFGKLDRCVRLRSGHQLRQICRR